MLPDQDPATPSLELTNDVAGIDASLRIVAAALPDDASKPEIGYYAAELANLRAAMWPRTDGAHGS